MRLSLVAAVAQNGVIGVRGGLPWRLSNDLRRFRRITLGHHILMGRKTWQSIGRPLPGRTNVVITRDRDLRPDGVMVVHSIEEAESLANRAGDDEAFVVGGEEIYRLALPRASRIHLTRVQAQPGGGDAWFPELEASAWVELERERLPADSRNEHATEYVVLERRDR